MCNAPSPKRCGGKSVEKEVEEAMFKVIVNMDMPVDRRMAVLAELPVVLNVLSALQKDAASDDAQNTIVNAMPAFDRIAAAFNTEITADRLMRIEYGLYTIGIICAGAARALRLVIQQRSDGKPREAAN